MNAFDCDYLIVGSGFGGSVCALRLAEKGWCVHVLEKGRDVSPEMMLEAKKNPLRLMWAPALRLKGYLAQSVFRHVAIVSGVGVGGGSLVWGAVMLEPKPAFYEDERLKALGVPWKAELAEHFAKAQAMLGVTTNPRLTRQDELIRQTAQAMGAEKTFSTVPSAIFFGPPQQEVGDPYFGGNGPVRTGCRFCGGCLTGCPYGSKNALTQNYLFLARNLGAAIEPESEATRITPLENQGYAVEVRGSLSGRFRKTIRARNVIVSAGVVGTLDLLYKNRDTYKTLPGISPMLGQLVRTNSEAFTAVLHSKHEDLSDGIAISSHFYPDSHTHITQNRFDSGMRFMRFYFGPLTDGHHQFWRALKSLAAIFTNPRLVLDNLFGERWEKRLTVLTVMQDLDNRLRFNFRRTWWSPWRKRLVTDSYPGHEAPSYLPIANRAATELAGIGKGMPMSFSTEAFAGLSNTAHILGGCGMSKDAETGVIDTNHEVHGYRGLYVVDGSSIPANIGVNPSLTITAMAERFASRMPHKPSSGSEGRA